MQFLSRGLLRSRHSLPASSSLSNRFLSRWPSRFIKPRKARQPSNGKPWLAYASAFALISGSSWVAYENYQPFRHALLAAVRCSRVAGMSILALFKLRKCLIGWMLNRGRYRWCCRLQVHIRTDLCVGKRAVTRVLPMPSS